MRVATAQAKELASRNGDALVLGVFLGRQPIGDVDSYLTKDEMERATRWVTMIDKRGIKVWEERATSV